ncbi:MAG: hypothetical protein KJ043_05575, partial [Anaerolineae bacterium]|nr:hypothetical protein [Anaerolineae bacterium]
MMAVFKKLNGVHIGLIVALPIILTLINPNWIFNLNMTDDYIYLGYQMALPKYVGWFPSDVHYFIERLSIILPGYVVRQIFSPLTPNFILHLGVYYVACFSVYGILNKLFHQRIAIIITVLFGQFSIVMRATGWDYPDGFAMAYFAMTILFLTYATQSKYRPIYLFGAGATYLLMITAHFFGLFYAPALFFYLLFLEKLYRTPIKFIKTGLYVLAGAFAIYLIQALFYYQLTGKILFSNSFSSAQTNAEVLYYFLIDYFKDVIPYWHIFLGFVAVLAIYAVLMHKKSPIVINPNLTLQNESVLHALLALFIASYGVIVGWRLLGYLYFNVSFYHANIVLSAFLIIGFIFSRVINDTTGFKYALITSLFLPMSLFFAFSIFPTVFDNIKLNSWLILFALLIIVFTLLRPSIKIYKFYAVIGVVCLINIVVADSPFVDTTNPSRYHYQSLYEETSQVAQFLNARYDDFSLDKFWFWYDAKHPDLPVFNSVASIYLLEWGRRQFFQNMPSENLSMNDAIILTSQNRKEEDFNTATALLNNRIQIHITEEIEIGDIVLLFLDASAFSGDNLSYYFDNFQSSIVLDESGWNDYEQSSPTNTFRWTAEPTARLVLDMSDASFDATATYHLSFVIAGYLEDAVVDSLTLTVNGAPIGLIRSDNRYVGYVAGEYLVNPQLELVFQTDRVSNPFDLGIQDG